MELLRRKLVSTVSRILHRREDAEDIAQEAISRLIDRRQNGEEIHDEAAFARQISIRLAIDLIRRRKGTTAHMERYVAPQSEASTSSATPAEIQRLYDAIAALPPRQAAVITLHKLLELEYEEVAALLGINQANCRSHCRHGLQRLRAILGETCEMDSVQQVK